MIELVGVSKSFGAQTVVAAMNWTLEAGRTHVLIGPSGCGKSTILRMMIGLTPPTTGEIYFDGEMVEPGAWRGVRRRMGYVIQDGGLFPHMTARDNVLVMARELRIPKDQSRRRLDELAELTHFPADALDRYPVQLSGGQKQRVGLMRALLLDPEVVLLDEPLAALDPLVRNELQTELRDVFRRLGKTVLLVTHDVGEARYFGDEITLLRRGEVVQRGAFEEFVDAPADPYVVEFLNAQRGPFPLGGEAPA
jgi:osmoprotectant transport system ATP-binding protein